MTKRCTYCRTEIDQDDDDEGLPICADCAVDPAMSGGDRDAADGAFQMGTADPRARAVIS